MSNLRKKLILLSFSAIFVAPSAISAKNLTYSAVWIVDPDQNIKSNAEWFEPSQTITSARLVPAKLFASTQDFLLDGIIKIPSGSKFSAVISQNLTVCGLQDVPKIGLDVIWNFGADKVICLVDSDNDGKFDRYFKISSTNFSKWGFLTGSGKIPSRLTPIDPVTLRPEDPQSLKNPPRVYIKYGWFASLAGKLIFQVCLNEDEGGYRTCLIPDASVKNSKIPGKFELLGSTFFVDAKDGNRVHVAQLTPIQRQPLFVD